MTDETAARSPGWRATTILMVRKGGIVIAGDGQVSWARQSSSPMRERCADSPTAR